ncbi:MAG: acylphosphatase [Proteobacteria bacterium]|nr:acylphosphatase [Pseudomonadota bacterium]
MSDKVRARVNIRGWVQGVAFRYKTKSAACEHQVNGWVRNRADGSVEAVFEGDKEQVDALLTWCEKGPKMAVVKEVKVSWETFTGEFSEFDIRF